MIRKKTLLKLLLSAALLGSPAGLMAQDVDAKSPAPAHRSKMEKKALKDKEKKKQKQLKGEKKARKQHEKIQSKDVKKRMKKSKKKAKKWNEAG
jgi:hypothetical protein